MGEVAVNVIDVAYDLDVPAKAVWPFVTDFLNIELWWPRQGPVQIERVDIEGDGIGGIRHIYNRGFPHAISERLDYLEPENYLWKLSIVCTMPAGLTRYQATGQLTPVDDENCRMTYHSEFETEPGKESQAREFLLGCYELMKQGLEGAARYNPVD